MTFFFYNNHFIQSSFNIPTYLKSLSERSIQGFQMCRYIKLHRNSPILKQGAILLIIHKIKYVSQGKPYHKYLDLVTPLLEPEIAIQNYSNFVITDSSITYFISIKMLM